jgi:hypothetical protein
MLSKIFSSHWKSWRLSLTYVLLKFSHFKLKLREISINIIFRWLYFYLHNPVFSCSVFSQILFNVLVMSSYLGQRVLCQIAVKVFYTKMQNNKKFEIVWLKITFSQTSKSELKPTWNLLMSHNVKLLNQNFNKHYKYLKTLSYNNLLFVLPPSFSNLNIFLGKCAYLESDSTVSIMIIFF